MNSSAEGKTGDESDLKMPLLTSLMGENQKPYKHQGKYVVRNKRSGNTYIVQNFYHSKHVAVKKDEAEAWLRGRKKAETARKVKFSEKNYEVIQDISKLGKRQYWVTPNGDFVLVPEASSHESFVIDNSKYFGKVSYGKAYEVAFNKGWIKLDLGGMYDGAAVIDSRRSPNDPVSKRALLAVADNLKRLGIKRVGVNFGEDPNFISPTDFLVKYDRYLRENKIPSLKYFAKFALMEELDVSKFRTFVQIKKDLPIFKANALGVQFVDNEMSFKKGQGFYAVKESPFGKISLYWNKQASQLVNRQVIAFFPMSLFVEYFSEIGEQNEKK